MGPPPPDRDPGPRGAGQRGSGSPGWRGAAGPGRRPRAWVGGSSHEAPAHPPLGPRPLARRSSDPRVIYTPGGYLLDRTE